MRTWRMDDALRSAYRAAVYRFSLPEGELLLKVDVPDAALARLLRDSAKGAAVVTAFNPRGQQQEDASNRAAQARLRQELQQAGYRACPGRNEDPGGEWPDEESFLVWDIEMETARAMAGRYDQLAFLWMDAASATPRLIDSAAPDPALRLP